ncbi:hypothetical protein LMG29542_05262 [Paraburkholderia humisilvae]|uniref:Uncharacterized protein n=1 Tax=Paraburkholderia humisilvae TaxID=627669 RepID=A0A6J5EKD0_9BURK|nr:hypothetical protein LMG29542_05262 [Paraburkholderia humisilvae]
MRLRDSLFSPGYVKCCPDIDHVLYVGFAYVSSLIHHIAKVRGAEPS